MRVDATRHEIAGALSTIEILAISTAIAVRSRGAVVDGLFGKLAGILIGFVNGW